MKYEPRPKKFDIEDETGIKRAFRRMAEISTMKAQIPAVRMPRKNGNTRPMTKTEAVVFDAAKAHALGQPSDFLKLADEAGRKANRRFFEVASMAMAAVQSARTDRLTITEAHVMAAIQAKLELEQRTDELPTQKQVKERAFKIALHWFKSEDFSPYEAKGKAWSKIFQRAGLAYLPIGTRGKGSGK